MEPTVLWNSWFPASQRVRALCNVTPQRLLSVHQRAALFSQSVSASLFISLNHWPMAHFLFCVPDPAWAPYASRTPLPESPHCTWLSAPLQLNWPDPSIWLPLWLVFLLNGTNLPCSLLKIIYNFSSFIFCSHSVPYNFSLVNLSHPYTFVSLSSWLIMGLSLVNHENQSTWGEMRHY